MLEYDILLPDVADEPQCGQETLIINPMMAAMAEKEGMPMPDFSRREIEPLKQSEISCEGKDCIDTSEAKPINDDKMPLISSDPNCPIIGVKFMYDDGNGIPTHEVEPNMLRVETIGDKISMTRNISAMAEALQSVDQLNIAVVFITARGPHEEPGQVMLIGVTMPDENEQSTCQCFANDRQYEEYC